ncbi:unnamed protein product, partial [Choristocarpus tenellus]
VLKCVAGGNSKATTLKKHALPAMEAILREVARYTASVGESERSTLDHFLRLWLGTLEGNHPSKEDTVVALTGLASFSCAAMVLCSRDEAANIMHRLCVCLDSTLGRLQGLGITPDEEEEEEEGSYG